ncbi:MAG: hypothetical protein AB1611_02730 [bacterium]
MNTLEHYQHANYANHTVMSGPKESNPMNKIEFSILPRERLVSDIEKRMMAVEKMLYRLDNEPPDERVTP